MKGVKKYKKNYKRILSEALKEHKPSPPEKPPDIAFWFDEKDPTYYLVKISTRVQNVHLILAGFDLLVKAAQQDMEGKTLIGEMEE